MLSFLNITYAQSTGLPATWNQNSEYTSGSLVISNGGTYLAQQTVPYGTPLTSTAYWLSLDSAVPSTTAGTTPGTASLLIVDLNKDGRPDILTKGSDQFFYWNQNQITYSYSYYFSQWASYKSGSFANRRLLFPTPISVTIKLEGAERNDIGSVNGTEELDLGSQYTLTATSKFGYAFDRWSGDFESTETILNGTLNSPLVLTAHYLKDLTDPDGDGLTNYREFIELGTNAYNNDTDGDGLIDGEEVEIGSSPLNSNKIVVDYLNGKAAVTLAVELQKSKVISREEGEQIVINDPQQFDLVSKSDYDKMVQELISLSENKSTPYTSGWFYVSSRSWIFTNREIFPYFYDSLSSEWMYFNSGKEQPTFYHYGIKEWIVIN